MPDTTLFASLNLPDLFVVDIEVAPNGDIWVLESKDLSIYILDEVNKTFVLKTEFDLPVQVSYLSVDVVVDFRFPHSGTYTVLLSTTDAKANIEEYVIIGGQKPISTGFYTVPV